MIDYITFDSDNNTITVGFADGEVKIYTQVMSDQYLIDYPDRENDLKAMGWMP